MMTCRALKVYLEMKYLSEKHNANVEAKNEDGITSIITDKRKEKYIDPKT